MNEQLQKMLDDARKGAENNADNLLHEHMMEAAQEALKTGQRHDAGPFSIIGTAIEIKGELVPALMVEMDTDEITVAVALPVKQAAHLMGAIAGAGMDAFKAAGVEE